MIGRLIASTAAALALAAAGSQARAAGCQMAKVADLPVTMAGLRPLVTAKINGKDALFLVDTGAFYSNLTAEAVSNFGLTTYRAPSTFSITGVAGTRVNPDITKVPEFTFAGIPLKHLSFFVLPVSLAPGVAGILGQNLLGALDVEYDLANGMIRLFNAKDCADANLAYWSAGKPLSIVGTDQQTVKQPHITTDARVNGHPIKVIFDTGASTSVMNKAAAARAGVDVSAAGLTSAGYASDIGGRQVANFIASLQSFGVGDEEIRNTRIRVAEVDLSGAEMLIGDDFFLSHRVMVARSQHKLYFTYNGGPVFRLDQQPKQVADAGAAAAAPSGDGPTTADEFSRRGSASAARRDLPAALADFGRAIALEPKDARLYYTRAGLRLEMDQQTLAMADLDQAIALKPDYQDALLKRGALKLKAKDVASAQRDFDAAMKASPTDKRLPRQLAGAYADAHFFAPSLNLYDAWIAGHPGDDELPFALNGRCWTRALSGVDLDKALADCDAALKRDGGWRASVMDSRGLVLLRLGRYDDAIAQYNTAIRIDPKAAWSLYGRGLAKLKTGKTAEGQADIKAAVAAQANIAEEARSFGVGPDGAGPVKS